MSDKEDKFCAAPFTKLSISPKGTIRPCCMQNFPAMYGWQNIKDKTDTVIWPTPFISELRDKMLDSNLEVKIPECIPCWDSEKYGIPSHRQKYNIKFNKNEIIENPSLRVLEIQFGSLCNLSCLMCGPTYSSHLYTTRKRLEKMTENASLLNYYDKVNMSDDNHDWTKDETSYLKLLSLCETITEVNISGGEPLFNPRIKNFLEFLLTKDIKITNLHITTNGTIYDKEIVDLINQFPNVIFKISLEGIEEVDEFIRWPTEWKVKDGNIKNFIQTLNAKTVKIIFSTVIQTLNIFNLFDVKSYVEKLAYANKIFQFQVVNENNINSFSHANPDYIFAFLNTFKKGEKPPVKIDISTSTTSMHKMQFHYYNDIAKLQNKKLEEVFPIYYSFHKKYQ